MYLSYYITTVLAYLKINLKHLLKKLQSFTNSVDVNYAGSTLFQFFQCVQNSTFLNNKTTNRTSSEVVY